MIDRGFWKKGTALQINKVRFLFYNLILAGTE